MAIAGQSILLNANAPNFGAMYVMLDDFHHRAQHGLTGAGDRRAAPGRAAGRDQRRAGQRLRGPAGRRPGDRRRLQDRGRGPRRPGLAGDRGRRRPDRRRISGAPPIRRSLSGLFTSFRANTPWLYLDIDRDKAKLAGVSIAELFNTLQVYLGSLYVNDFNRFGRTWQVNVQGDANFRKQISDLTALQVRNEQRRHGPARQHRRDPRRQRPGDDHPVQPVSLRHDQPATRRPGVSSGQAIDAMERLVQQELPQAMRSEWTELALLQLQTGNTAMFAFMLAVVLVFLVLAAQYESWSLPLAVILVVPMCLLCSIVGVNMARDGHQHLHPGRLHRPGGPGVQERDPDRRVRQGRSARRARRASRRRSKPASSGSGRS